MVVVVVVVVVGRMGEGREVRAFKDRIGFLFGWCSQIGGVQIHALSRILN